MKRFRVNHTLTSQQIKEADIHEGDFSIEGHPSFIGYCLGPDDDKKTMYATPEKAYAAFTAKAK